MGSLMLQRPGKRARRREQRRLAQTRWRDNVQNCAAIYPLRLDASDLQWLQDGLQAGLSCRDERQSPTTTILIESERVRRSEFCP
jgi:hypothetical protein